MKDLGDMKARKLFSFFLILLTGAWLRLHRLATHDLWYDEKMSYDLAYNVTKDFCNIRSYGMQPPFYYFLPNFRFANFATISVYG